MEKKRFGEVHETTGIMNFSVTGSMLAGDAYREQSAYKAGDAPGKIAFSVSPKVHITAVLGWTDFFNQNPEGLNLDWFSAGPDGGMVARAETGIRREEIAVRGAPEPGLRLSVSGDP